MAYADNFASAGAGSGKKSFDVFTNLTKKLVVLILMALMIQSHQL
jgi:hypothetical protein